MCQLEKDGILRATFRHNQPNHKIIYQNSKVILLISIGQEYHEGEKFNATINLINRSGFKKCFIMLGDSIQRHNILINDFDNENAAHIQANKLGDEWLERNKPIYGKLKIPYEITRWDRWLRHPSYNEYRMVVNKLYQRDDEFRRQCLKAVNQFLSRFKKNNSKLVDDERAFKLCLEYLLEECAIIIPLWARDAYEFLIYPSEILDGMKATHDILVSPLYPNVLYWLSLRFKRKESYKDE